MFEQGSAVRGGLGQWMERAASPLVTLGNNLRESSLLRANSLCFHARVRPAKQLRVELQSLARRLEGDALVRLATGLWQEEHRLLPDLLSCAIRFKAWPPMERPTPDAQDLVLVSARNAWTLPLDSVKTDQSDFLLNQYYGVVPFRIEDHGNVQLRVTPDSSSLPGIDRNDRIRRAVEHGGVKLRLDICDKRLGKEWLPLVEILLSQEVDIEPSQLQFWPFRNGQGITPQGMIEYLRPVPDMLDRLNRSAQDVTERTAATADSAADATLSATRSASDSLRATVSETRDAARRTRHDATHAVEAAAHEARLATASTITRVGHAISSLGNRAYHTASAIANAAASRLNQALRGARVTTEHAALQTATTLNAGANSARETANRMRDTAGNAAARTADRANQAAAKTANRAGQAAAQAGDAARQAGQQARQTAREAQAAARDVGKRAAKASDRVTREARNAANDVSKRVNESAGKMAAETRNAARDAADRVDQAEERVSTPAKKRRTRRARTSKAKA